MTDRNVRIAEEIKRVLSAVISSEIKDPRIAEMTSVMKVTLTKDLRYAKAFISVMGTAEQKKATIEALVHAEGFVKKCVSERVKMRLVPSFSFVLDESIDASINIARILEDIKKKDERLS